MLDTTGREQRRLLSLPVDRVSQNLIELEFDIRSRGRNGRCYCGGLGIARLNFFRGCREAVARPASASCARSRGARRHVASACELPRPTVSCGVCLPAARLRPTRPEKQNSWARRDVREREPPVPLSASACTSASEGCEASSDELRAFLPRRVEAKRADGACRSRPSRRSVMRDVLARTRSNSLADTVSFCTAARCTARGPATCVTCVPARTSRPTGGCPTLLDAAAGAVAVAAARADDCAHKLAVVPDRAAAALADTGRPKRSRPIIRWLITLDDWKLSSF